MTVIVGMEHEGKAWLGADSAVSHGWATNVLPQPKLFRIKDFLMGGAGYLRTLQLVQFKTDLRAREMGESAEAYLVNGFAAAIQKCLSEQKHLEEGGHNETSHNEFLFVYENKLYKLDSVFAVSRSMRGFNSVGAGAPYALGALAMMKAPNVSPAEKLPLALEIAASFMPGCITAPFGVEEA